MLTTEKIRRIRQLNRDYTRVLGVMNKQIFGTTLSWPEGRIMIEIGLNHLTAPMQVASRLGLDRSYTSRTINRLVKRGLIEKLPSPTDSRSVQLRLTPEGRRVFAQINARSDDQLVDLIRDLSTAEQEELYASFATIDKLLFKREGK